MIKSKLVPLLLVAVLTLSACGSQSEETATEAPSETTTAAEAASENTDSAVAPEPMNAVDYKEGLTEKGFLEGVTAKDYVTLFDLDKVEIPADVHQVTDEAVQAEVDGLVGYFTTTEPVKDRAVEDGDSVNIDYVGSVDGVAFEGGSTGGNGTDVTIGVTAYIDDFLQQLIGHKPGETFDINVTFPEDYGNEDLSGKDAVFVTTVNHINKTVVPELTDDFVATNLKERNGWSTVQEMTDGITKALKERAVKGYIQSTVLGSATAENVPDSVVAYQKKIVLNYYKNAANQQQKTLEDFLAANTEWATEEDILTAHADDINTNSNYTLIIQAIAEEAGIEVMDEDIRNYFLANSGTEDYSQAESLYGIGYLRYALLQEKVLDYLVETATLL